MTFVLPVLGFGDEQPPPTLVTWRDGTVLCRGILGSYPIPEQQPDAPSDTNVISLDGLGTNEMPTKKNLSSENRGGRGFGVLQKEDRQFLTPDFDDKRQSGQRYVGYYNKVSDTPGRSDDA